MAAATETVDSPVPSASASASSASSSPSPTATSSKFHSEQLLTDEQILALGIGPNHVEMYRRMAYQRAFGINKLVSSPLAKFTFATEFVTVTYEQARALYNYILHTQPHRSSGSSISEEELALVGQLRQAIDEKAEARWPGGQWFAKLDTRSAKDAVLADFDSVELQQALRNGMLSIPREQFNLLQANLAFVKATNRGLACRTSADVLHQFELSQRITQDIGRQLDYGAEHFELPIVLREWLDEVCDRPQYEFRCFVHELKLNAITQYFDWMYFPELHERKQELQDLMVNFFYEHVAPVAPFRSFVIDFYITSDNHVLIIEFNPFHNGAGAGLFSWAKDRERFFNGPLEFRIRDPPTPEEPQIDVIPARWTRWLRAELPELFPEPQPEQQQQGDDDGGSWCGIL